MQFVEQAPSRVRKRLDDSPSIAESWEWVTHENGWSVRANDETVELTCREGVLQDLRSVACSCLMAPKCLHILAVASSLQIDADDSSVLEDKSTQSIKQQEGLAEPSSVGVTSGMKDCAKSVQQSLTGLLRKGARNAGVLMHSGLLRSAHACRISELHALSNTVFRIAHRIQQLRIQADESDSHALQQDIAWALQAADAICTWSEIPRWMVGYARRSYTSIELRNLEGVFAEPVWTASGFAGVSIYLQDPESQRLFTIQEMRPGDERLIGQAYYGGVDLGGVTIEANRLCRQRLTVQNLEVSQDGRLGKGKATRWAMAQSTEHRGLSEGRFQRPLEQQIEEMLVNLKTPVVQRSTGWDLLCINATLLGASNENLVVQVDGVRTPWKLGIANDSKELAYRHNLQLLAHCPGLTARCLVRLDPKQSHRAYLLALADSPMGEHRNDRASVRLELPESWQGLCNAGLDRLERHYLVGIDDRTEPLDEAEMESLSQANLGGAFEKYTQSLQRRLIGLVLGGADALPRIESAAHRRDTLQLKKLCLPTAASLLDLLAVESQSSRSVPNSQLLRAFLACDIYLRSVEQSLFIEAVTQSLPSEAG